MQHFLRNCGRTTDAVERAAEIHKEECEQRLAKLQNTPKEKLNTPWPGQKPGEVKE